MSVRDVVSEEMQEHKHIVLVGPAFPYRGGIAHFLASMYHALVDRGHEVSVVTFSRQYPDIVFPGKSQYESDTEQAPFSAKRWIDSVNPFSWFATARAVHALKPDAVVFKYWLPFFAPAFGIIAWMLRKNKIRIIGLIHNALPHEQRMGDGVLSRFFLKQCDRLIVMSHKVEQDLDRLQIQVPVKRVGHPVYHLFGEEIPKEEGRKKLGIAHDRPVMLFFGFIRRYKGLHVLLESMPDVIKQVPGITLIVAGECYENEHAYREHIAKNGLSDHVDLHMDYIAQDEVNMYFSAADVVVQPYISATQSGVAQIAYHFDRPLIVTDVGGLAEIVPHEVAGLVVDPDNPDALASAIIRFFKEHMESRLTEGVRKEKENYSWSRLCETLEGFIA